jgi:hypothetical protein
MRVGVGATPTLSYSLKEAGRMGRDALLTVRGFRAFCTCLWVLAVLAGISLYGLAMSVSARAACSNIGLRDGRSAGLPDCRAYEQVSPVDKGGFSGYARGSATQVSNSGEAIAYMSNEAFPGSLGNTASFAAHVSTRDTTGWKTVEWSPKLPQATMLNTYEVNYNFSEDLSQGFLQAAGVELAPESTPYVDNIFRRGASGAYSLINAAKPVMSPEEICGSGGLAECWQYADLAAFAGASSNLNHVLFESSAQLLPGAPETFAEGLYENLEGNVKLVGILPDGKPAASSTAGAGSSAFYPNAGQMSDKRAEHAISTDGSRVVFQAPADGAAPDPAQSEMPEVYDRIGGGETIELSAPESGAEQSKCEVKVGTCNAEPASFWEASADGSRVFFTSTAELTTQSNTGPANSGDDLYEYNFSKPAGERLTDLTVDFADANGAEVQGVVDTSADGSYVYFVAYEQLVAGKGVTGQPNLYVVHNGGMPVFIATLNSAGTCELPEKLSADSCDWTPYPLELEAYVAPDGQHLAFMSTMSLPTMNFPGGYDNTDQNTSEADSEIYLYSAPTEGENEGRLMCASCDPSGAQPIGNALLGGIANVARVPEAGVLKYRGISTPFYRVHALSNNGGRLFYTAPASKSAPFERVYEYEQNGEGTCDTSDGCQYLLSSGGGESDQFLGASADGADAYFASTNPLVASDIDELRDVYDARVGGGVSTPAELICESNCRQPGGTPSNFSVASNSSGPSGNIPVLALAKGGPKKKCGKGHKLSHGRCVKKKGKTTKKTRTTNKKRRER